jgi:starch phosphorylase
MFVVHVKRIHEYKRQLLAILQIIALYHEIRRDPQASRTPRVFVFAGKAAAGYQVAKLHIKLINDVAAVVNADPTVAHQLRVAFIPNYSVTLAEAIIPAADLSLQISLAGQEASGTGNMKLAMNGAVTLGTLDGANVEILEEVGRDNMFCFGLDVTEVAALWQRGYRPRAFMDRSARLSEVLDSLRSGLFSHGDSQRFAPIVDKLMHDDRFMVCADFEA